MRSADEQLKIFYDSRADEEPHADPEAELRFLKALRAASLKRGDRLLDVGAKWGGLGAYARSLGLDISYTGLELSQAHIDKAEMLGLDVRPADATGTLPVESDHYDVVVCLEVLEHLTAPLALLEEMHRVLKREGRVVVSVPNPYSWIEVCRELTGRPDPEGHLNGYTTPIMTNLLALAGFRVERVLGTSLRVPVVNRLISTDSVLARSRIYVARPAARVVFAGRDL